MCGKALFLLLSYIGVCIRTADNGFVWLSKSNVHLRLKIVVEIDC